MRTAEALVSVLSESVEQVRGDEALGSAQKARVLARLSDALLRASEQVDVMARIDELQTALGSADSAGQAGPLGEGGWK